MNIRSDAQMDKDIQRTTENYQHLVASQQSGLLMAGAVMGIISNSAGIDLENVEVAELKRMADTLRTLNSCLDFAIAARQLNLAGLLAQMSEGAK
ncbi:hypothetical protein [Enterobacter sp. PTB]|uniref:hypothetical protein n=1 Tax=Enterobacter sp. PTB TaxID=3143437 RepID=UPI003DA8A0F9